MSKIERPLSPASTAMAGEKKGKLMAGGKSKPAAAAVTDSPFDSFSAATGPRLRQFGVYCARNQVKVLLLHCLVVVSVVCCVWPFDRIPGVSGPTREPLFWEEDPSIASSTHPVCWGRVPVERELHLLQIKSTLTNGDPLLDSEHGALERSFLHKTLLLQHSITSASGKDATFKCVAVANGECLVASPLTLWNSSESTLLSDRHILNTLESAASHSQISQTGFSGLFRSKSWTRSADELSLSWPLERRTQSNGWSEEAKLMAMVKRDSARLGNLHISNQKTQRFLLREKLESPQRQPTHYDRLYIAAYLALAAYVGFVMRRLEGVYSRAGMLLVAMISMVCSGLVSLSVCKMLGFRVDGVPWKLLPILITVLAVDNTRLLISAVVSTSVELPIPERIGEGVAKIGPQILLALIVEHVLLFLAFTLIPVRAVREMTLLAAIALKADAAMQMTFFLPILSIDIQRLELADLLSQGRLRIPPAGEKSTCYNNSNLVSVTSSITRSAWSGAKQRLARSIAFVVITTSNLGHRAYYGADYFRIPAFCADLVGCETRQPSSLKSGSLWTTLNPGLAPAIHVYVYSPIYFTFGSDSSLRRESLISAFGSLVLSTLVYRLIPVATICSLEYFTLIFLLRDGELLQAEKTRVAEAKAAKKIEEARARASPQARGIVLPARTFTDVEKVTVARGGGVISWSVTEKALVCQDAFGGETQKLTLHDTKARLAVVALALSDDSSYCATADSNGVVYVWDVKRSSRVVFPATFGVKVPVIGIRALPVDESYSATFLVARADGSLESWNVSAKSVRVVIAPALLETAIKPRMLFLGDGLSAPVVARIANDTVEVFCSENFRDWQRFSVFSASEAGGPVTAMAYARAGLDGESRSLFVTGNQHGRVVVFDGASSNPITEFAATSAITQVRIMQGEEACCPCVNAGECASTILAFSTSNAISFKRLFLPPDARICDCLVAPSGPNSVRRSRSASSFVKVENRRETYKSESEPNTHLTVSTPLRRRREAHSDDFSECEASPDQSTRSSSASSALLASTPDSSVKNDPAWYAELRMVDLGEILLPGNAVWDCCGGLMLAGLLSVREPKSHRSNDWEAWSVDLSNEGLGENRARLVRSAMEIRETPTTPRPSLDENAFKRRKDPLERASLVEAQKSRTHLPFSRVASMAISTDQRLIAASFGNAVAVLRCPQAKPIPPPFVQQRLSVRPPSKLVRSAS